MNGIQYDVPTALLITTYVYFAFTYQPFTLYHRKNTC